MDIAEKAASEDMDKDFPKSALFTIGDQPHIQASSIATFKCACR
jgi:hypothetical protein